MMMTNNEKSDQHKTIQENRADDYVSICANQDESFLRSSLKVLSTHVVVNTDGTRIGTDVDAAKSISCKRKRSMTKVTRHFDVPSTNSNVIHSCKRKRSMTKVMRHSNVPSTNSNTAMQQAEKILQTLPAEFPSFAKTMQPSNVSTSFWLCLPAKFCAMHMSQCDHKIVLEDEDSKDYQTTYIAKNHAFSGGWKRFAQAHQLVDGDVLIFHKIMSHKFKVIILRAKDLVEKDEVAFALLNLSSSEQVIAHKDMGSSSCQQGVERPASPLLLCDNNSRHTNISNGGLSIISSLDLGKFQTDLHDCDVYAKLPEHLIITYYELCCSQKMYLHQHLLGNRNSIFVAGIIAEVTSISDSIRLSSISTPLDELREWDKQLEAFELLGMEVRFLRERLLPLTRLASDREEGSTRAIEAGGERDDLIYKVVQMNQTIDSLNKELECLKKKEEIDRRKYDAKAGASW